MSGPHWQAACPLPSGGGSTERITLAHGEGGRLMRRLIGEVILPVLARAHRGTPPIGGTLSVPAAQSDAAALGDVAALSDAATLGDAAVLPLLTSRPVLTTDSFVVSPLFFPGGDIGQLAVYGTVNDLVVAGAVPRWLSLALVLEEGLPVDVLARVLESIARAARESNVSIVTGDTKVVPRGTADGLFITTTGLGELVEPPPPGPAAIRPGDRLIVSGPIGQHGMAVLCSRESLGFDPPPRSDSASLAEPVAALRRAGVVVRALRDATRGGVAAVLHEWAAAASGISFEVDQSRVPVSAEVRGACELLGLDPMHVANEGTFVAAVAPQAVDAALAALAAVQQTVQAADIGQAVPQAIAPVLVRRTLGSLEPLDEPAGAPLPRIC